MKFQHRGFTLIELVVVIVILGILAATALPKFVNLGSDARAAKVNAMAGTLRSVAATWNSIAMMKGCSVDWGSALISYQGKTVDVARCYPNSGDNLNGNQVDILVDTTGFTITIPAWDTTVFAVTDAADSTNCRVEYVEAKAAYGMPIITPKTSSC